MNNTEIAKKVIEALGGRENVNSVAHCATRLRVMVKDEGKIDKNTVENLEKVQGAFFGSSVPSVHLVTYLCQSYQLS